MFDEQPDDNDFDAVIARYAQACQTNNAAVMREGYIQLRAMCETASPAAPQVVQGEVEREAFEAWLRSGEEFEPHWLNRRDFKGSERFGEYCDNITEGQWRAWQARAALASATPPAEALTDAELDQHIDAVLRASGSALRNYSMQKSKDDMRAAMRAAIDASIRAGKGDPQIS